MMCCYWCPAGVDLYWLEQLCVIRPLSVRSLWVLDTWVVLCFISCSVVFQVMCSHRLSFRLLRASGLLSISMASLIIAAAALLRLVLWLCWRLFCDQLLIYAGLMLKCWYPFPPQACVLWQACLCGLCAYLTGRYKSYCSLRRGLCTCLVLQGVCCLWDFSTTNQ